MLNIKKPKTVIEASKERIAAKMAEPMKNIVIGSLINFKSFFIFLVLNIHIFFFRKLKKIYLKYLY